MSESQLNEDYNNHYDYFIFVFRFHFQQHLTVILLNVVIKWRRQPEQSFQQLIGCHVNH